MPSAFVTCPSCAEPLPIKAKFCPSCGTATPAGVDMATGQVVVPERTAPAPDEGADHRDRLQRALGDGLKIRRLLGRGGFAEVWSAFDVRLKREVAVKTLRYDLVISDTLLQRFQREAEAVAKLRHPNIIPIYEVGEGEGIAYFVMPMIEGESLGEALEREGQFSIEETCRILREAGSALAAAHRAEIVHRDIKPDNIMLEGAERRPIVMDFGIAKATSDADARLTGTGMAMGTPHYMSPEQASGERNLDARSDQYALALVGYRMLVGRSPFAADTMASLILKQITEVPKPPIEVRPDVPRELSNALSKALSKDPASRFQRMEEFVAAVPQIGSRDAGSAPSRPRPTATELARFPGAISPSVRDPLMLAGLLGLVLAVGVYIPARQRAALATASRRSDALFVGRAFLNAHGANGSYDERMTLLKDDTAYVWLQRAFGTRAADDSAIANRSIFRWNLRWERQATGNTKETWNVDIGANRRIARFAGPVRDTARLNTVSTDSARRIAEAFLRGVAIDVATLTPVQDSVIARAKRTDHLFVWDAKANRTVGPGADTTTPRVRVVVAGDRVDSFRSSLETPASFVARVKRSVWRNVGIASVILGWTVLVIASITLAFQRQRTDDLQWKAAARLSVVALVFIGLAALQSSQASFGTTGESLGLVVGLSFLGVFVLFGLLFGIVSAESLANEVNPRALVGLDSVSRLRLSAPEWPAALLRGFAIGALAAGLDALGRFAATLFLWRGPSFPDGVNVAAPWSLPLVTVGAALTMAILTFFATHLILKFTKRPWLAIGIPALFVGFVGLQPALQPWITILQQGLIFGLFCWTMLRFGFLTAAVGFWVSEMLPAATALLAVGNDIYLTAGSACVVSLVAIPALGLLARRRSAPARRPSLANTGSPAQ